MALDNDTIKKVAQLAKLGISPDETTALKDDLNNILAMIDELQSINTDGVTAMAHPLGINQPLRDDVVTHTDQRAQLLANAPATEDGHILVPKVIE